jgi:hypothetical protein
MKEKKLIEESLPDIQIDRRDFLKQSLNLGSYPFFEVDDGFIISSNYGEFGGDIFWISRDCPRDELDIILISKEGVFRRLKKRWKKKCIIGFQATK